MWQLDTDLAKETQDLLLETVKKFEVNGKGILAADEDVETTNRRLKGNKIDQTEDNRRMYRQVLFTCDKKSLSEQISGVILAHETFYQKADDGTPFVHHLTKAEPAPIQVGITMDKGLVPLGNSREEFATQGLDSLRERAAQYKRDGASFAKWRSVYKISNGAATPSYLSLVENSNTLARYASLCQQNGLVPIVEPDILREGDHDLETAQAVMEMVWCHMYKALVEHHVFLEGTILKTNMVLPGKECTKTYTDEDIAKATLTAIQRKVPAAVPVVSFLSGGQTDEDATRRLGEIIKHAATQPTKRPWYLTFCFGRALTTKALETWQGKENNVEAAQQLLLSRAKACGEATKTAS